MRPLKSRIGQSMRARDAVLVYGFSRYLACRQTIESRNEGSVTLARICTLRALPYRPRMRIGWLKID
jgi:hypothetical protein